MTTAIAFYDVAVALHVMAILVAFGAVFAYPVLTGFVLRTNPQSAPALYGAIRLLDQRVVSPMAVVALALGAYLATDADVWSKVWVTVPLIILVIVMGLIGAVFSPSLKRLSHLAARDLTAGGTLSADTMAEVRRLNAGWTAAAVLVLVAVFFMVAKPG